MCFKLLLFNISTQTYRDEQDVQWMKYLNGFSVHNTGTTNLIINNDIIPPQSSKTIGGNYGEIYAGRIDISFRVPSPAPPVITNQVIITQKFYLNPEGKL